MNAMGPRGRTLVVAIALLPRAGLAEAPTARGSYDVIVSPKSGYVHVLWNVASKHAAVDGPKGRTLIPGLVARLVTEWVTKDAPSEVRVDVVVVLERDSYGRPRWDGLRKVARLIGRRETLASWVAANGASAEAPETLFEKVSWY